MYTTKKHKRGTASLEEKKKAKGCFSKQRVFDDEGNFEERKHEACDWRNSKKGFIQTGLTWNHKSLQK